MGRALGSLTTHTRTHTLSIFEICTWITYKVLSVTKYTNNELCTRVLQFNSPLECVAGISLKIAPPSWEWKSAQTTSALGTHTGTKSAGEQRCPSRTSVPNVRRSPHRGAAVWPPDSQHHRQKHPNPKGFQLKPAARPETLQDRCIITRDPFMTADWSC